jgi:hypothetical protein
MKGDLGPMRQNFVVCLLAVCATLLAVNLAVNLRSQPPLAFGQSVAEKAGFILAAAQAQGGGTVLYVFETESKKLALYQSKGTGFEFVGSRTLTYDLDPSILEFMPPKRMNPREVKDKIAEENAKRK